MILILQNQGFQKITNLPFHLTFCFFWFFGVCLVKSKGKSKVLKNCIILQYRKANMSSSYSYLLFNSKIIQPAKHNTYLKYYFPLILKRENSSAFLINIPFKNLYFKSLQFSFFFSFYHVKCMINLKFFLRI